MADQTIEFFIPFYGDPRYLLEAVESLRAMHDPDWRVTVLDDCYPHADVDSMLAQLGDARVRVARNDRNLGANGNYRTALEVATADYVVILGADDRVLPNYLTRIRSVVAAHEPDIAQPGASVIDDSGHPHLPLGDRVKGWLTPRPPEPRAYRGQLIATSLLTGNWAYFPSLCWRRETVQRLGFRPFHVVQDLALIIDVLMEGGTMAIDPTVAFEYRRHRASDSSVKATTGERFDEEQAYLREIAVELDARGWRLAALAARARLTSRLHAGLTAAAVVRNDGTAARRLLRNALT
ncbi:glycosyltransferase family 2 protein [Nocardioides panacisoli]|uniref:Glycosyltransferase 2-like domain-containing protein n=1 Tax=Nocardioides panacisoli TaxID=627624 RepID=A0ABP7I9U3_9ACTN